MWYTYILVPIVILFVISEFTPFRPLVENILVFSNIGFIVAAFWVLIILSKGRRTWKYMLFTDTQQLKRDEEAEDARNKADIMKKLEDLKNAGKNPSPELVQAIDTAIQRTNEL